MTADTAYWIALAGRMGAQAWDGFLPAVGLAMLAAGCGSAWKVRGHQRADAGLQASPVALRRMAGRLAAGFVFLLATASVFATLAQLLGDGRTLQRADEAFRLAAAASVPPAGLAALRWLTHLGEPLVLTLLGVGTAAALWTARQRGLTLGWIAATGGNAVLNPSLKHIFARARPLIDGQPSTISGFSFPSGHSSGALVTWGMLAYLAWRLLPPRWHIPATVAATGIVLTTAASRVFLQAHFASDVVAGLCSGAAWLTVCIAACEYARHRRVRRESDVPKEKGYRFR